MRLQWKTETLLYVDPVPNTAAPLASGSTGSCSNFKRCSTCGTGLSEYRCQVPTFLLKPIRLSNIRNHYFEIEIGFGFVYVYI